MAGQTDPTLCKSVTGVTGVGVEQTAVTLTAAAVKAEFEAELARLAVAQNYLGLLDLLGEVKRPGPLAALEVGHICGQIQTELDRLL